MRAACGCGWLTYIRNIEFAQCGLSYDKQYIYSGGMCGNALVVYIPLAEVGHVV